jgi:hypothetical protein
MEELRTFYVGAIPAPLSYRSGNYVREGRIVKRYSFFTSAIFFYNI